MDTLCSLAEIKNISLYGISVQFTRFSPSVCEYRIADLKLEESKKTEDSLTKIMLLDSALAFIQHARNNFLNASANLNMSAYLLGIKNRNKLSALVDENK
jgi:hypothetical protein